MRSAFLAGRGALCGWIESRRHTHRLKTPPATFKDPFRSECRRSLFRNRTEFHTFVLAGLPNLKPR
jgi:hypothetical protein